MTDIVNNYVPIKWQEDFHGDPWRHACCVGGRGSGKTVACIQELLACAMETPGTTYLIGRKTLPSLLDSTWKALHKILPEKLIKEENKQLRNITLVNGSTFIGRPLDEPRKFDSMEISGFFIDEADEVDKEIYDTLKTRVREQVIIDGKRVRPRYRTIIGLNPTEEDHWIPQLFLHEPPAGHKLFFSSAIDNMENLPEGYIEELRATYSSDMLVRQLYGQFGKVHKGRPVYPQFSRGNYVFPFEVTKGATVFRFHDFGFNRPAILWTHFINGQLQVIAEKMGQRIYLQDFIADWRAYEETLFPAGTPFRDFCDPHGADETDKGSSSVSILNEHGIYPVYRRTFIEEGIKAIKELMDTKNHAGDLRFMIHPRCKILIEGLRGGYHRVDGDEQPEKDNYYDHLCDCLRYGAIHLTRRWKSNSMQAVLNAAPVWIHPITGRRVEL